MKMNKNSILLAAALIIFIPIMVMQRMEINKSIYSLFKSAYYFKQKDFPKAVKLLEESVFSRSANGKYLIASIYYNGKKVPQDYDKAFKYFTLSSSKKESAYMIGYMYYYGQCTEQNTKEALNWVMKAADKNFVPALHMIGYIYYMGQQYKDALKWFRKAADKGYKDSEQALKSMSDNNLTENYNDSDWILDYAVHGE